jgi:hypothetical protein
VRSMRLGGSESSMSKTPQPLFIDREGFALVTPRTRRERFTLNRPGESGDLLV